MDTLTIIGIAVLASILITCAIMAIFFFVAKSHVIKSSTALKNLSELNSRYCQAFDFSIKEEQQYTKRQKSKSAFDKANHYEIAIEYLYKYGYNLQLIIETARRNALHYNNYSIMCGTIYENRDTSWYKFDLHERIELSLFEKQMLDPPREITLRITNSYTSPKGQNRYSNYIVLDTPQIEAAFAEIDKREKFKQTKQYQRSIMTDSLRYDIMKRDGFKCVLCGCSADDGVKLHVDHIVPVAKGGLTVASNLRTLCEHCNLGKSDKYDSQGVN